jgi:predicted transposase YbfD/YdcC
LSGKVKPLLVAAMDSRGLALEQVLAADGDELGAVRAMVTSLDLEGALVSADALHCCVETAKTVLAAGADYLFCVKGNRPELRAAIDALPWAELDNAWEDRESGHGRDETRTVKFLAAGGAVRLDFPGARQVARVRRWRRDNRVAFALALCHRDRDPSIEWRISGSPKTICRSVLLGIHSIL